MEDIVDTTHDTTGGAAATVQLSHLLHGSLRAARFRQLAWTPSVSTLVARHA